MRDILYWYIFVNTDMEERDKFLLVYKAFDVSPQDLIGWITEFYQYSQKKLLKNPTPRVIDHAEGKRYKIRRFITQWVVLCCKIDFE